MQCDVKGLYKTSQWRVSRDGQKARAGQIADFTGISSPYETLQNPEFTVNTGAAELEICVQQVIGEMTQRGIISPQ
ncbi:MAG: adenylyl-sulfate kinase [Gallionella sp.]|nr:adenylyl-sulfate kinase [Gallionella sp.]